MAYWYYCGKAWPASNAMKTKIIYVNTANWSRWWVGIGNYSALNFSRFVYYWKPVWLVPPNECQWCLHPIRSLIYCGSTDSTSTHRSAHTNVALTIAPLSKYLFVFKACVSGTTWTRWRNSLTSNMATKLISHAIVSTSYQFSNERNSTYMYIYKYKYMDPQYVTHWLEN